MNDKIKIIALDLDGTLTGADHITISEENKNALKKAHDKGAKIAIATGRTIEILGSICDRIPEIDYIIYSNGAGVIDKSTGEIIYENKMDADFAGEIYDYLDRQPAFIEAYADGKSCVQQDKSRFFATGLFPQEFIDELMKEMTIFENLGSAVKGKPIEKFTIYITDPEKYAEVKNHLAGIDEIDLVSSWSMSMEFTKKGADKGAALKGICEKLGIAPEECMAFGDAGNDVPMLKYAKYGFAMENGSDECKNAAFAVTKSNIENGVAFEILKYFD